MSGFPIPFNRGNKFSIYKKSRLIDNLVILLVSHLGVYLGPCAYICVSIQIYVQ